MRLKRERNKAQLTQMELSALSGVSQSFISRLENNEVNDAAHGILDDLAKALRRRGCSVLAADLQPRPQPALIKGFRSTDRRRKRAARSVAV